MLVLNNTPFVHSRGYLQYLNSALPGDIGANTRLRVRDNLSLLFYRDSYQKTWFFGKNIWVHNSLVHHNIIQIHKNVLWDWQYSTEYSTIHVECEECSTKYRQSHKTLLWVWIMLCLAMKGTSLLIKLWRLAIFLLENLQAIIMQFKMSFKFSRFLWVHLHYSFLWN